MTEALKNLVYIENTYFKLYLNKLTFFITVDPIDRWKCKKLQIQIDEINELNTYRRTIPPITQLIEV